MPAPRQLRDHLDDIPAEATSQLGDSAFKAEMKGAHRRRSVDRVQRDRDGVEADPPKPGPVLGIDVEADGDYPVAKAVSEYGRRSWPLHPPTAWTRKTHGIVWDFCSPVIHVRHGVREVPLDPVVPGRRKHSGRRAAYGLNVQLRPIIRVGPPRNRVERPGCQLGGHYPARGPAARGSAACWPPSGPT